MSAIGYLQLSVYRCCILRRRCSSVKGISFVFICFYVFSHAIFCCRVLSHPFMCIHELSVDFIYLSCITESSSVGTFHFCLLIVIINKSEV